MSLCALFCVDHFCHPGQDCFQDLRGNGLNQMRSETSALTFSHIRFTAPYTYGDGLPWAPPPHPPTAAKGPNRFRPAAGDHLITSQIVCQTWQPNPRLPVHQRQPASDDRAPEEIVPFPAVYHRDLRLKECAKFAGMFDKPSLAGLTIETGTSLCNGRIPTSKAAIRCDAEPRVGPSLSGLSTDNSCSGVQRSPVHSFGFCCRCKLPMRGAGTLNLDSAKTDYSSSTFRTSSALFPSFF